MLGGVASKTKRVEAEGLLGLGFQKPSLTHQLTKSSLFSAGAFRVSAFLGRLLTMLENGSCNIYPHEDLI